jgi:hypothetical protein
LGLKGSLPEDLGNLTSLVMLCVAPACDPVSCGSTPYAIHEAERRVVVRQVCGQQRAGGKHPQQPRQSHDDPILVSWSRHSRPDCEWRYLKYGRLTPGPTGRCRRLHDNLLTGSLPTAMYSLPNITELCVSPPSVPLGSAVVLCAARRKRSV